MIHMLYLVKGGDSKSLEETSFMDSLSLEIQTWYTINSTLECFCYFKRPAEKTLTFWWKQVHQYRNVPSETISPHCMICSSNGCGPAMDQWITLHLNGSDAQRPEAITTKAALPGQKASAFTNSPVSALWWLCTHCLVTRAERQIYIHAAPLPPPPHSWA